MAVTYKIAKYTQGPMVSVTFTDGEVIHTRDVNVVITDGKYDKTATEARVKEVALGVEHKIKVGVIKAVPEEPEATPE